ncbi:Alpha/Beta hydrolase protein [Microdochium trichocladiopsis]|uniref:Alpha/Beta hydrolase protein n=1 Tax=Microdochium trichocladiopsis TaxID=1682393 RepID=A0A9P8XSD8_9PEZI|nr:Alpha/Beta hydrolase protein [Microdochium trichocladiopsis]KAH7009263.1 Alpha/Beta hydrolase protein [Microdochium trichocladiopsis]
MKADLRFSSPEQRASAGSDVGGWSKGLGKSVAFSSAPHSAAIVVGHPGTGIKEQTSGLYARSLASQGFITLAFDAAHYGESGGEPRYLEDPYQRVEDFRNAVSFLSTLDGEVDPERIGTVGICSSGGFSIFAAQTDQRIKAVATVNGVCVGTMTRNSMKDPSGAIDQALLQPGLVWAGRERTSEARGNPPTTISILDTFAEAADYYQTPRGQHPRCANLQLARSLDTIASYDSFAFIDWISPRPLLMIIGSEADKGNDGDPADTGRYSRMAIERAREPKELFVIKGLGHIDLYDHMSESVPKLADFMGRALCA